MRLWKKIGNYELDLLMVWMIDHDPLASDPNREYYICINGRSLPITAEQKAEFDKHIQLHEKTLQWIAGIEGMQSGGKK